MIIKALGQRLVLAELLVLRIVGDKNILTVIGSLDAESIIALLDGTPVAPSGFQSHLSQRNRSRNTILLLLLNGHRSI